MQIEQNEVYEKVRTMFISGVFQTTRGRHCFFYTFSALKNIFQEKNPTTFLKLPWGISGRNMQSFDFSSCATYL